MYNYLLNFQRFFLLYQMCETDHVKERCEKGVGEERVTKFEILSKEPEKKEDEEEEEEVSIMSLGKEQEQRIERAKKKVKLWLTNNFGEPDVIELMIPAR